MDKKILSILIGLLIIPIASAQLNISWSQYPLPNITSIASIFTYDNSSSGGWFTTLLVGAIWTVLLIVFMSRVDIAGALSASSIIATVLSIILMTSGLLGDAIPMIFIALSAIGIVLSFRWSSGF